jgi:hypothetical protein
VVAFLRVMNGIYAPVPFQLRRPSRVVYGHCFDRALYRGFERHLTPGIEWDEKRGRRATAAFERAAPIMPYRAFCAGSLPISAFTTSIICAATSPFTDCRWCCAIIRTSTASAG